MLSAVFLDTQTQVYSNLRFQAVGIKACDKCSAFSEAMLKNVLMFQVQFDSSLHYSHLALWLWLWTAGLDRNDYKLEMWSVLMHIRVPQSRETSEQQPVGLSADLNHVMEKKKPSNFLPWNKPIARTP